MNNKIFKDPVHGYIEIPIDYCHKFIDTLIFQRLRNIEQTNMRVLFPTAHHDRFSHSLGVYHLGNLAFNYLLKDTNNDNFKTTINELKNTFLVACLMHDCAHAPFSHTFEKEYDVKLAGAIDGRLDIKIKSIFTEIKFLRDYKNCSPAAHEKASAIILYEHYDKELNELGVKKELAVRMILGCKFHATTNQEEKIQNCFIELLNSSSIDVDKLDYIVRDTWISGVSNSKIDTIRLLSALTIGKLETDDTIVLAFKKRAISVIRSVIDGRNYLYKWIYSHHKVIYNEELLVKSVKELARFLYPENPEQFFISMFDLSFFKTHVTISNNDMYLINDGDILYLLKKHIDDLETPKKFFSRKHEYSLWKSFEEYDLIFDNIDITTRGTIKSNISEYLKEFLENEIKTNSEFTLLDAKPKINDIKKNTIFIHYDSKCIPLEKQQNSTNDNDFYYLYLTSEALKHKDEIIKQIKTYR